MKVEHCTRCTPLPKYPVLAFRSGKNERGRDAIKVTAELVDTLCECSDKPEELRSLLCAETLPEFGTEHDPGCIFYRPKTGTTWERALPVELSDGKSSLTSAPRAAFIAAHGHRDAYLLPGMRAVHLCKTEIHDDIRLCCINPAHIVGQ
jgi:hypothetical protein